MDVFDQAVSEIATSQTEADPASPSFPPSLPADSAGGEGPELAWLYKQIKNKQLSLLSDSKNNFYLSPRSKWIEFHWDDVVTCWLKNCSKMIMAVKENEFLPEVNLYARSLVEKVSEPKKKNPAFPAQCLRHGKQPAHGSLITWRSR